MSDEEIQDLSIAMKHPLCPACGYDLYGLVGDPVHCPECGKVSSRILLKEMAFRYQHGRISQLIGQARWCGMFMIGSLVPLSSMAHDLIDGRLSLLAAVIPIILLSVALIMSARVHWRYSVRVWRLICISSVFAMSLGSMVACIIGSLLCLSAVMSASSWTEGVYSGALFLLCITLFIALFYVQRFVSNMENRVAYALAARANQGERTCQDHTHKSRRASR